MSGSASRLDEAVVAVLALVEHAQARGVGVAEDDELVRVLRESHRRLLRRHGFDAVAARGDDARLLRRVFGRGGARRRLRREGGERGCALLALDYFLLELDGLLLDLVNAARQGLVHVN